MTDAIPATPEDEEDDFTAELLRVDRRSVAMVRAINKHVQDAKRFITRVNRLQLMPIYSAEGTEMSQRLWTDPPDVQLLLERRDRYLAYKLRIDSAHGALLDKELAPEVRLSALGELNKMERLAQCELEAMEEAMQSTRASAERTAQTTAGLVTKLREIVQKDDHHHDRIALLKRQMATKGMDEETLKRLAGSP